MGATAIISDLHLGSLPGEGLLEHGSIRERLLGELARADRVVLLGDAVEMRDLPIGEALAASRPFFEELGEATGDTEIVLVPGNHDHHFAAPIIESAGVSSEASLGLEQRTAPQGAAARRVAEWLGGDRLTLAYPGLWLRDDVYAMHGHHMDPHFTLPRAESVAAAAVARVTGPLPDPASPDDYERLIGPVSGLTFGLAQAGAWRRRRGGARPSERAFTWLSQGKRANVRQRLAGKAIASIALPTATMALNRLLRAEFEPDLSPAAISGGGVAAATELAERLRVDAAHVIMGHTHHAGPHGDAEWPVAGGGQLHNTGNWIFARLLHRGSARGGFWPGTVTWLGDRGAPERVPLLDHLTPDELAALTVRTREGRAGSLE